MSEKAVQKSLFFAKQFETVIFKFEKLIYFIWVAAELCVS